MGLLVDGVWQDRWYDTKGSGGAFRRDESRFRNWVTPDGAAGPTGEGGFPAVPGRYHLYVSLACPWAHRTLILRAWKGLGEAIGVSVVNPYMGDRGWTFEPGPGVVADDVNGAAVLHEVYTLSDPHATGRVTVPVLWDRATRRIVSNESADIIRMMNDAFDECGAMPGDYQPEALRPEIDALNARIYDEVNNGVYKAGFATTQAAYEAAVFPLFAALDWLEEQLRGRRFLCGPAPTLADVRLFTTLVRFDAVYVGHFKCNIRRLVDYPALWGYTRDLFQWPGVRETVSLDHIRRHYYTSHPTINPTGVVPAGPVIDFEEAHGRERLGG